MSNPFSDRPHFVNYNEDLFAFGTGAVASDSVCAGLKSILTDLDLERAYAGSLWGHFDQECAGDYGVIRHGTYDEIRGLAKSICASNLTHGYLQGKTVYDRLMRTKDDRRIYGSIILDRFLCLAEAVGAIRAPSPMHGQRTIEVKNPDGIFARIEEAVGVSLLPPEQDGALYGLRIRGKVFSDRHFEGIYTAWRIRELTRSADLADTTICEIGGGGGHLAFYARKLGCRRYAIIDLPQAQLMQYLVLATNFGVENVHLTPSDDGIELVRVQSARSRQTDDFQWIVNVDSLPEMTAAAARDYIDQVGEGQSFLSINQESGAMVGSHPQSVVRELASAASLRRVSRYPFWMRTGYVEEVYTR
jgi:hypothetical protein